MALITQSDSPLPVSPSRGIFAAAMLAELKTFTVPLGNQTVEVDGSVSRGDGLAGTYYWNATDSRADNGTTIIASNAGGVGRWNLVAATALDSTFTPAGAGAVAEPVQTSLRRIVALPQFDTQAHYDAAAAALVDSEISYAFKGMATNEQTIGSRIYLNLNVKGLKRSFGAIGDDTADDTTAVTNAFASGKTIEIEDGTYKYSSGASMTTRGIQVRGYGDLSVLHYTGAGVAMQAVGSNDSWTSKVADFKISTTTGTHGLRLKDLSYFLVDSVSCTGFSTAGFHLTGTAVTGLLLMTRMFNCRSYSNTGDGVLVAGVNALNQISIIGCGIQGNLGKGISMSNAGYGIAIIGNEIEGNGAVAELYLNGGGDGYEIAGNYFESSAAIPAIIVADTLATDGGSITGNRFVADVAIANAIRMGVSAFAHGWNVSGNSFINLYTNAINAQAAKNCVFGPNYCAGSIVHVANISNSPTGITVFNANNRSVVTYSASMTPDCALGNEFDITATNGTAFTINAPSNASDDMIRVITLRNTSGGALGAATWDAVFKMSAWTNPANGFSRSITFKFNGTNWAQIAQTGVDVPN